MTNVRLYRDAAELHGRDLFACSLAHWRFLQELGQAFGWTPEGTTYELRPDSKVVSSARHDYEPGAASDRKVVSADDARRLARALEDAMTSPDLPGIIARLASTSLLEEGTVSSVIGLTAEFIQYGYGGAFTFSRDDR